MNTEENKIEQYSEIETKIRSIGAELDGKVYDITTGKGLVAAKADRAIWRKLRTGVDAIRKETKADVLALGRAIDGEAKRLTEIIVDGGAHVESVVKAEEDRKAVEKQAREDAERRRIEAIHDRIDGFKFLLSEHHPVDDLTACLEKLEVVVIDESYAEFQERANAMLEQAAGSCRNALTIAVNLEAEAAEAETKRATEVAVQAEKQAGIDKANAEKQLVIDAENKRLAAERAEFEAEKAESEKADREEKAKARDEKERADAKCETLALAMLKILNICNDPYTDAERVRLIRIVVEENPAD